MNFTVLILIVLAVASRLVPHLDNAAAITAVGIFSGFLLPKRQAFAVPLAARFVTDLVIGLFAWQMMAAVYVSHLAGVALGLWVSRSEKPLSRWIKIFGSGIAAAVLFFLVTNLAFAFMYPATSNVWANISQSYVNALPFFRGTAAGDIGYTVALFGLYEAAVFGARFFRRKALAVKA